MPKNLVFLCWFLSHVLFMSELRAQERFPQGYFIMPVNPGKAVSLSGAFADIRTNHFHAGLDIRTGGAEGKVVHAAAAGYVSRMKVQNGGYGNALYITHPNGYTTLYAHLKVFSDTLQKYLVSQQYKAKSWEIDINLEPHLFKLAQGDTIALSGNTGGSAGPHLHFEIRDTQENVLDPSQFGFIELKDTVPPVIEFISIKTMSEDARVNGRFGTLNFPVIKGKDGLYRVSQKIQASGQLAIEVLSYDRTSNSPFRQGINQINLNVNQALVYNFKANKFSFHNKLDMNCHVNYEKMISKGQKIHRCYVVEGNSLDNYSTNASKGIFKLNDGLNTVDIRVNDAFANTVALKFEIEKTETPQLAFIKPKNPEIKVQDQFLYLDYYAKGRNSIKVSLEKAVEVYKNTADSGKLVSFVWNLKKGIPQQIYLDSVAYPVPVNLFLSAASPKARLPYLNLDMGTALYAPNYVFTYSDAYSCQVHSDIIPLKGLMSLEWTKPGINPNPEKAKVYIDEKKPKFIGGEWTANTVKFKSKEYGRFKVLYDFEAPYIKLRILNSEKISFSISDDLSGIAKIEAYLNEAWLLMNYEYKSGLIWAEKIDKSKPFVGNLVLKITDNCNNTNIFSQEIIIPDETRSRPESPGDTSTEPKQ
jgi:murein DD-endopeptidase MepM/ murein hydrolase activator NlpD